MIKFGLPRADFEVVEKIVDRIMGINMIHGYERDRLSVTMDVKAVHLNGNPLRFQELLEAEDVHFYHDVFGIQKYLDRDTGKLTHGFTPRYSAHPKS